MNNQNYNADNKGQNSQNSFDSMNQNFKQQQQNQNYYLNNVQNSNMYNNYVNKENISSAPPKEKIRYGKVFIPIIIVGILLLSFTLYTVYKDSNKKIRTFMIYMVGSDLESQSKQGTYSIEDIVGNKIDLENNNIVLMVGGSKKWHNFVDPNEIGIYELTENGFTKKKSLELSSMGNNELLTSFLNYSYNNYPAKNYDMIFWNHGLGSIGIEQDEVSNDYLSINELNIAFENSKFKNKKLEMTIFYNCLASNLHIAKVMSNYSNYMLASEEIFYLSKVLNRLNFLEEVRENDSAYDIGIKFINQSDKVVNSYNATHNKKIDSTLSIIDLSKIKKLDEDLNNFIKEINVSSKYSQIANVRREIHTYGNDRINDYDTVDLYELVESLESLSNNKNAYYKVLNSINDTVAYTSNLNDYSNGISIYFPYYGSRSAIQAHLDTFTKMWNDNYISFINSFYQMKSGVRRDRNGKNNELKNDLRIIDNKLLLDLTEEEKNNYQDANIYLFKKDDSNKYELLLKTKMYLNNTTLETNEIKTLKVNNNNISLIQENLNKIYGTLSDSEDTLDIIFNINLDNLKIDEAVLDSKEYPASGLIEYNDYDKISFYKLKYYFTENEIEENWKETEERENIEFEKNSLEMKFDSNIDEYYALVEMYDIYNEVFYSKLVKIK